MGHPIPHGTSLTPLDLPTPDSSFASADPHIPCSNSLSPLADVTQPSTAHTRIPITGHGGSTPSVQQASHPPTPEHPRTLLLAKAQLRENILLFKLKS